jgi:hypothetical protein
VRWWTHSPPPDAMWRWSATGSTTPALKQAHLAIAQRSGAQMARSVAALVLVRNDFAVVPGMVGQGRQILRNIQRVAQLFCDQVGVRRRARARGGDSDRVGFANSIPLRIQRIEEARTELVNPMRMTGAPSRGSRWLLLRPPVRARVRAHP